MKVETLRKILAIIFFIIAIACVIALGLNLLQIIHLSIRNILLIFLLFAGSYIISYIMSHTKPDD